MQPQRGLLQLGTLGTGNRGFRQNGVTVDDLGNGAKPGGRRSLGRVVAIAGVCPAGPYLAATPARRPPSRRCLRNRCRG